MDYIIIFQMLQLDFLCSFIFIRLGNHVHEKGWFYLFNLYASQLYFQM